MNASDWVVLGVQLALLVAILMGAWYNSKNFKYNRETFASQLLMITMLQARVTALESGGKRVINLDVEDPARAAEFRKLFPEL